MKLSIKADVAKIRKDIKSIEKKLYRMDDTIKKIATTVRNDIVKRTERGIDVNGSAFTPYSKDYQTYKKIKGKDSGKVNMRFSSRMMKDMKVFKKRKGVIVIGFATKESNDKAYRHIKGDGVPKRKFFGLSKKNKRFITKSIRAAARKAIK